VRAVTYRLSKLDGAVGVQEQAEDILVPPLAAAAGRSGVAKWTGWAESRGPLPRVQSF